MAARPRFVRTCSPSAPAVSVVLLLVSVGCSDPDQLPAPPPDKGLMETAPADQGTTDTAPDQGTTDAPSTQPPRMAVFDSLMIAFMAQNNITTGALGVRKDGVLVHQRGYGHLDPALTKPTPDVVMMRLASVSKPLTAAAIHDLVRDGKLKLGDHAFDLGQAGGGILGLKPFPSVGDPRLAEITVQHLLRHRGGWDRGTAGDLSYEEVSIAKAMGLASPPGRKATVRYILGQPLQFKPGDKEIYDNIGYLVLGLIIEQITGKDYLGALRALVLAPLGVSQGDLIQGRTFPKDRSPREPWYDYLGTATNVFAPSGPKVHRPAGGWDHEARIAQGGLVATTTALLGFLDTYLVSGDDIGALRSGSEGVTWKRNHTGSLPGSNALARQRGDGINYVVLFNKRPVSGTTYASQIRGKLDALLESGSVIWPK